MLVKYEMDLLERTDLVNEQLARYGVKLEFIRIIHLRNNFFRLMRFHVLLKRNSSNIWKRD